MKTSLEGLTVSFNKATSHKLTETWTWLIGADKEVLLVSTIGDLFLTNINRQVYWLDVGGGELTLIANSLEDFEEKLKDVDQVNEWFMIDLATELNHSDKKLKEGQLYSYYKLPILGGSYTIGNFAPLNIEEHFGYLGDVHKQIKDLPNGTKVTIRVVE